MFDIKETIKKRLKAARTHKGWTFAECGAELTKLTGKTVIASRYGNWELGINIPPLEMLFALGQILDKPPAYLAGLTNDDGTAPETREYAVPTVSTVTSDSGLIKIGDNALAFRMQFLESIKLNKKHMLLVVAPDDAMAGIIEEGDRAVIDLSETTVTRNDVFAIMVKGRLWLRWIRQTLQGDYLIQAERGDRYPDQPLTPEELEGLHILGRVRIIAHLR
ncbi:LexA family transcriptional regulator (plasmid) [Pseudomonas sp. HN2]|uniref:XRE family transcriptional regulator n=1 Tax=Pseudomonas sp. HN2 TaxID=2884805 RepID=UPI001D14EE66|nr:LexA family transcriptional regulator [Pseudomonas sp. HN2]UEB98650.1 LexA family transcriptional regulator [Pseudomonas sp. HN2]UEB98706.1 LexA family transcriptional regulator [Pseudomonas sp. HN2]